MSLSQYEAGKRYQTTKGEYYRYLPQEQALVFEDGRVVPVPANSLRSVYRERSVRRLH